MRLNKKQQEAVTYTDSPCLVIAGAGSGKTRVIINKIIYLIQQKGYLPKHIAAVTFTNKAAKEMQERISQSLDKKTHRGVRISTFHTLGLDIIRKEHSALQLKPNFSLFDDLDQTALLKEITHDDYAGDKESIYKLKNKISLFKNGLVSVEDAYKIAKNEEEQQYAYFYEQYQHQLRACSILDFDDLILLPTLLFKHNSDIAEKWQNRIRYLLVDEYQDTNEIQYQFIQYLVGNRGKFTVVGDDDQSIYSWRGARPQNMVLLQHDFSDLNVIKLEQNYRSTSRILNAANILIQNNPHHFDKKLYSELGDGDVIQVINAENEDIEAEKVVNNLINHHFLHDTQYGDYAILYRSNHQSILFEKYLNQYRIPYHISGETSFFSRVEIKDVMAYLRLLVNPNDDNAFIRIINTPRREIGTATLQKIGELSTLKQISLFEATLDPDLNQYLSGKKLSAVTDFCNWLNSFNRRVHEEPMAVVNELLTNIDYENWLFESSPTPKAASFRQGNVELLLQWLETALSGTEEKEPCNLEDAVMRFTLRDMLDRNSELENEQIQVQLMTLHSSKGLEFPYVYLTGLSEGLLPHQNSIDNYNIEEERRLAYVGITRAKKRLILSYSLQRRKYGELIQNEPSRFLLELPQDDLDWKKTKQTTPDKQKQVSLKHIELIKARLAASK